MVESIFHRAYPIALRAAQVRSAAAARVGFPPCNLQDLEQEAVIRVWQALSKYDPARAGVRTFIEIVVTTRIASMLRSHRHRPRIECLDSRYIDDGNRLREMELRMDVRRLLAGVSWFDKAVALSLVAHSITDTSRNLGVSRSVVYQAVRRLRVALAAGGFGGQRRRSSTTCQSHVGKRVEALPRESLP